MNGSTARRMLLLVALLAARSACGDGTGLTVRVMAANITSGRHQRYEAPGIRIFQGLKPDVVAIQEFNYVQADGGATNTPDALREFVDTAFGPEFSYYREPYASPGDIPNGVISRWPIVEAGSWDDPAVPNRGIAWARIDIPGTNDLYVVSAHLAAGKAARDRQQAAALIRDAIRARMPTGAWVIVGGDLNTRSRNEGAMRTLGAVLSDAPVPTDAPQGGDPDTNQGRTHPYDAVQISYSLTNYLVPVVIGGKVFPNGLVFDSRVYTPLADVAPVEAADCGVFQMQHLPVCRDLLLPVAAPPP